MEQLSYSSTGLPGRCDDESQNLVSIVRNLIATDLAFQNFDVDESIASFADSALASKLAALSFFFMVDMELSPTGWDATSQTILANWVSAGNTLLMTGTYGTSDVNFLNDAFGWNLSSRGCSTSSINAANTAGTKFAGGSPTLGCPSATDHINCSGVSSCKAMWGTETDAAVAVFRHGLGTVVYLGFDYYNTGYAVGGHVDCGARNDPWVTSALRNGLLYQ